MMVMSGYNGSNGYDGYAVNNFLENGLVESFFKKMLVSVDVVRFRAIQYFLRPFCCYYKEHQGIKENILRFFQSNSQQPLSISYLSSYLQIRHKYFSSFPLVCIVGVAGGNPHV